MDILFIMSDTLKYPHPPDPNIDYGEPGRPDSTCSVCEQVWLKEDFNGSCTCPACRPVEELNEADEEWWGKMTRGCEKYHKERDER